MAGGMNNPRNQAAFMGRLARQVAEAGPEAVQPTGSDPAATALPGQRYAGDDHDPWPPILQLVSNDSARWALALAHAHETTGTTAQQLHSLSNDAMEVFAAAARAWLDANPPTRSVRPW